MMSASCLRSLWSVRARFSLAAALPVLALSSPLRANDDFEDAIEIIALPYVLINTSNQTASVQTGEVDHVFDSIASHSLWWKWTAPTDEEEEEEGGGGGGMPEDIVIEINTVGSDYDTVLAVYRGSDLANLEKVVSNDDLDDFTTQSRVRIDVIPEETYYIAVDGFTTTSSAATGDTDIRVEFFDNPPPSNDDWEDAIELTGTLPLQSSSDNTNATVQVGEPIHLTQGNHSSTLWWKWSATTTGSVSATTLSNSIDTIMAVYKGPADQATGSFDDLVLIGANDDGDDPLADSSVGIKAQSGQTYYFAVDGVLTNRGDVDFEVKDAPAPPPNDDFANATEVTGGFAFGTTQGATSEAGEDDHSGAIPADGPTSTAWWKWTPAASTPVEINTFNSIFNTVLAVYIATPPGPPAVDTLTLVGRNDNSGGLQSRVRFTANDQLTYYIAVDGRNGAEGSVSIEVIEPGPEKPPNDDFVDVVDLGSALTASDTGTNIGATVETGEPSATAEASVWWKWTAPATAKVDVNTFLSDYNTTIGVYTGTTLFNQTLIGFNDNTGGEQSRVIFDANAGTTYHIVVGGAIGAEGLINLTLTQRGSYALWLQNYPAITGADAGPCVDIDGDGFTNLEEMFFDLDPLVFSGPAGSDPNIGNAPVYTIDGSVAKIEYRINPGFVGILHNGGGPVTHEGELGTAVTTLSSFTPTLVSGTSYRVEVPVDATPNNFVRLVIRDPNGVRKP